MKKATVILLLGSLAALAGCQSGSGDDPEGYTYHSYVSGSPNTWNPHTWEDSSYEDVAGYATIGLVDFTYDPEVEGGYKVVYELADSITDVSLNQSSAFNEKWGLADEEGNVEEGHVWQIKLNKDAKFASGKAITADTWVESMELCLSNEYKNYRANSYYSGDFEIPGAFNFYHSGDTTLTNLLSIPESGVTTDTSTLYLDWENSPLILSDNFLGSSWEDAQEEDWGYAAYFTVDGVNLIQKYKEATVYTEDILNEVAQCPIWAACGLTTEEALEYAPYYTGSYNVTYDVVDFSVVGLIADDDYTLTYITKSSVSLFNFQVSVASELWLVNPELYEEYTTTSSSGLKTSSYGTSVDTYDSYGPYRLATYEDDKQFTFERNENWYGWTDGKHDNQFQTTRIVVDVIPEHSTALLAFEKGDLDDISLEQADLAKYGSSDYLLYTPQTYTMRFVFDSNKTDLKALETAAADGANKQILQYKDFRKAISLAIDRKRFNAEGTAGNQPAYALLNSLYYYDVENDSSSIYRNTDQAKRAIVDYYGIEYGDGKTYATLDEAYNAVTGLDVDEAKKLFESAYEQAIADGTYTDGQAIKFNVGYYDATTTSAVSQIALLNEFVATATQGTHLEGKITFTAKSYNGDMTRYDAICQGEVEIANCAWGGAAFYPFNCMQVYCDPTQYDINEIRSWDPRNVSLDITYDFDENGEDETVTKTYYEWSDAMSTSGTYGKAKNETRLEILSRVENGVLNQENFAVVGSYASVTLHSQKINYATDTYNIMYGYGGIRYMTYNYNNGAWSNYVSGTTLKY